jgi:cytosine/uracil/thiamine/allantoin permease
LGLSELWLYWRAMVIVLTMDPVKYRRLQTWAAVLTVITSAMTTFRPLRKAAVRSL